MPDPLDDAPAELALRYLKYRWSRPAEAARAGSLALADVDLDPDWTELERAVGVSALEAIVVALLGLAAPPAAEARFMRALTPDLEGEAARAFLSLFALNVAFRIRSDATLTALVASLEAPGLPRPAPAIVGRLLARARSMREARALIAAAPLTAPVREAALAGLVTPLEPPPAGARLHLEAEQDIAQRALAAALRPRALVTWSRAGTAARRLLLLRRTGGWVSVVASDEALERDLVPRLARVSGVRRAAWSCFGEAPDLLVQEGTRVVLDRATLEARAGEAPTADDVAGALRGIGVLDLDPEHPRGRTALRYAEQVGGGPPLGIERRLRRRAVRAIAFE